MNSSNKVIVFDAHKFERALFEEFQTKYNFDITFLEVRLNPSTAPLAKGFPVVCCFANDKVNAETIGILKGNGTKLIATRSAGFNHIDVKAAKAAGIPIVRVPKYSPYAIAEHACCLLLALNRKIHRSYHRVRELNFSLDGLVGFDVHGKTVGIIGTGKIGEAFAKIMIGFGTKVLAFDIQQNQNLKKAGVSYVSLDKLYSESDIISLHVPLTPETKHLIDAKAFAKMKAGVYLINTGRGALIDTKALIQSLKDKHLGAAGLDVYEEEEGVFFNDLSEKGIDDDLLARLLTFPNVLITSHQAFLTREALHAIVQTTLENIKEFEKGGTLTNQVVC